MEKKNHHEKASWEGDTTWDGNGKENKEQHWREEELGGWRKIRATHPCPAELVQYGKTVVVERCGSSVTMKKVNSVKRDESRGGAQQKQEKNEVAAEECEDKSRREQLFSSAAATAVASVRKVLVLQLSL